MELKLEFIMPLHATQSSCHVQITFVVYRVYCDLSYKHEVYHYTKNNTARCRRREREVLN